MQSAQIVIDRGNIRQHLKQKCCMCEALMLNNLQILIAIITQAVITVEGMRSAACEVR